MGYCGFRPFENDYALDNLGGLRWITELTSHVYELIHGNEFDSLYAVAASIILSLRSDVNIITYYRSADKIYLISISIYFNCFVF